MLENVLFAFVPSVVIAARGRQLLDAVSAEIRAAGGQVPLPGEDGVAMTERVRGEVTRAAATHLEGRFGHWSGFTQWAPQTADRILSYLITGN